MNAVGEGVLRSAARTLKEEIKRDPPVANATASEAIHEVPAEAESAGSGNGC